MKSLTERLREQRRMYLMAANYFEQRGRAHIAAACLKYAKELERWT